MEWAEWIKQKRHEWIGQIVLYDGWYYSVEDVDSNGCLLIDKTSGFNDTTAVSESDVKVVPKSFVQSGREWKIDTLADLAFALASLRGNEFVANMSDSYAVTCSEIDEIRKQRRAVFIQAAEKGIWGGKENA